MPTTKEDFVNAHSSSRDMRAGARRRLLSKAYRRGFSEGFGAPFLFFNRLSFSRTESIDASVEMAWKAVGKALADATKAEEEQIVKATGKAEWRSSTSKRK